MKSQTSKSINLTRRNSAVLFKPKSRLKPDIVLAELEKAPNPNEDLLNLLNQKSLSPFTRHKNHSLTRVESQPPDDILDSSSKKPNDFKNSVFQFPEDSTIPSAINQNSKTIHNDISNYLISAKESLYDLRQEAKQYWTSSKKLINEAQKSRRSSFAIEEFRNYKSLCQSEVFQDPIKDLTDSIIDLKTRVLDSERKKEEHAEGTGNLKHAVKKLEKNIEKFNELKLENESKNVGCTGNCEII